MRLLVDCKGDSLLGEKDAELCAAVSKAHVIFTQEPATERSAPYGGDRLLELRGGVPDVSYLVVPELVIIEEGVDVPGDGVDEPEHEAVLEGGRGVRRGVHGLHLAASSGWMVGCRMNRSAISGTMLDHSLKAEKGPAAPAVLSPNG